MGDRVEALLFDLGRVIIELDSVRVHARWAELAGIPVAAIGLAGYLTLLATTFVRAEWARAAAVALSLSALVFSAYLLVIQVAVIDAVCAWCVASDCLIVSIAVIAVADATRSSRRVAPAG